MTTKPNFVVNYAAGVASRRCSVAVLAAMLSALPAAVCALTGQGLDDYLTIDANRNHYNPSD